ncbi:hypothetical protein MicvaDRAFT_0011 [Microcoleus vaginatus FGP-2]|nr:hypothetical protein MicvaDRAFT_0011 [Microcoleus vaginatus FGP-2]
MSYSTVIDTQLASGTNLTLCQKSKELYVLIKDDVVDQIIEHGLSKVESKLFFYFLKLDRFGDRPAKVKVAEILLATGVSKSVYHTAVAKFERMGWFSFTHADVQISNYCTPRRKSEKSDSYSEKSDSYSEKSDSYSEKSDSYSEKSDSKKLKVLPGKGSKTSQTIQTYSDLLQTLSEGQRESFEKFCLKKIEESSFKITSREGWLNKHGAEYLREFKDRYSEALANPELIAPKIEPSMLVDIPYLKRLYGNGWQEAANHFGYTIQNSPEVEIQSEPEPVASSEVVAQPIVASDNPQEPTPPTPAIGAKHKQFAEGDRVVIAEVGNTHHGQAGKVIAVRSGCKEDEYRIALDNESHFVRELTIKIPKGCKFTYLMKL